MAITQKMLWGAPSEVLCNEFGTSVQKAMSWRALWENPLHMICAAVPRCALFQFGPNPRPQPGQAEAKATRNAEAAKNSAALAKICAALSSGEACRAHAKSTRKRRPGASYTLSAGLHNDPEDRPHHNLKRPAPGNRHQAVRPHTMRPMPYKSAGKPQLASTRKPWRTPTANALQQRNRPAASATRSAATRPTGLRGAARPAEPNPNP